MVRRLTGTAGPRAHTVGLDDQGRKTFTTWRCWRGGTYGTGYKCFPTEELALAFAETTEVSRIDIVVETIAHDFEAEKPEGVECPVCLGVIKGDFNLGDPFPKHVKYAKIACEFGSATYPRRIRPNHFVRQRKPRSDS